MMMANYALNEHIEYGAPHCCWPLQHSLTLATTAWHQPAPTAWQQCNLHQLLHLPPGYLSAEHSHYLLLPSSIFPDATFTLPTYTMILYNTSSTFKVFSLDTSCWLSSCNPMIKPSSPPFFIFHVFYWPC
jgi:hypothetical protein